ncbi:hypothetical protein ACLOJK_009865 [Asimina triloba]
MWEHGSSVPGRTAAADSQGRDAAGGRRALRRASARAADGEGSRVGTAGDRDRRGAAGQRGAECYNFTLKKLDTFRIAGIMLAVNTEASVLERKDFQ